MKSILLLAILSLFTASCEESNTNIPTQSQSVIKTPEIKYKTITITKVIKDLKEVQEQHTSYHTELNVAQTLWDGDVKTAVVPDISTTTSYYVIYTDKTHDEVDRNTWLNYSKGDTIIKYKQIKL